MEARQRNIVFPDTVRNDRLVNELFWKGSPNATRLQRIGIAFLSIVPFGVVASLMIGVLEPAPVWFRVVMLLFALPFAIFGGRMLRNAFLRPSPTSDHEHQQTDHKHLSSS